MSCLSDKDIWIQGDKNILGLYSFRRQGLLKSIKTNSGKRAENGALTRSGDQVRTDKTNRTVNIVKNKKEIQTVITLQGRRPHCVCSTSSGDIQVVMESDAWQIPSQVVRYSGYTVKQSIQYNENGDSLFINWLY